MPKCGICRGRKVCPNKIHNREIGNLLAEDARPGDDWLFFCEDCGQTPDSPGACPHCGGTGEEPGS